MTRHPFNSASLDLLPGESSRPPLRLLEHRHRACAEPVRSQGAPLIWSKMLGAVRRVWGG